MWIKFHFESNPVKFVSTQQFLFCLFFKNDGVNATWWNVTLIFTLCTWIKNQTFFFLDNFNMIWRWGTKIHLVRECVSNSVTRVWGSVVRALGPRGARALTREEERARTTAEEPAPSLLADPGARSAASITPAPALTPAAALQTCQVRSLHSSHKPLSRSELSSSRVLSKINTCLI